MSLRQVAIPLSRISDEMRELWFRGNPALEMADFTQIHEAILDGCFYKADRVPALHQDPVEMLTSLGAPTDYARRYVEDLRRGVMSIITSHFEFIWPNRDYSYRIVGGHLIVNEDL